MSGPPPSSPIRRLDDATVQRIAAGEVVERPASVVKELVENAVDAGASEVRISLEGGGLELIRVEDDGSGIPAVDLPLALERHATSKLRTADELDRISTLGFRGEALASIGAVSRLRIASRPPGEEEAHGLSLVAGQAAGTFVEGRAPGTAVEVRDLFFNTPARRKFLRAPAAEQLETVATVERLYLARPTLGITLANEHGELERLPPSVTLRDAAARVLGPEFLAQSFEIRGGPTAGVRLRGLLARPAISRSTAQGLYLSANGRSITSRVLVQAVRQAYADYLPRGRYPVGIVHLEVEPGSIDVNVHPTKREVRLAHEREVADALRRSVRESLLATPHVADRPEGTAAPEPWAPLVTGPAATDLTAPRPGLQTRLSPPTTGGSVRATARHPELRLIGPVFELYWLAESEGHLVLLDQHAASERVVYEHLRSAGQLARQELVEPVRLELGPHRRAILEDRAEEVRRAGYDVEAFGPQSVRVRSVPTYRGRAAAAGSLAGFLDEVGAGGRPTVPDGLQERRDASIACHAAIRAGDVVSAEEMQRVIRALYDLPGPSYACPHGRPILVRFPRGRIDRWFLRSPE